MTTPSSQMKISGTRLKTNESMVDSVRILSGGTFKKEGILKNPIIWTL
jgi:hypothetical protein